MKDLAPRTHRAGRFGVVVAALICVLVGAVASGAGVETRSGTIAFIRLANDRVFRGSLFVVRPDGTGLRQVTPSSTNVDSFAWSPDGKLIAYTDRRGSLWLVRRDGSGCRLLLPDARFPSVDVSWSPDGTRVAIATGGPDGHPWKGCCARLRLYVVPTGGSHAVALPAGKHIGYGVSWSPRGDEIYYDNGGIWAIRPDGTGRRQISPVGSSGSLSGDGAKFVFNVHLRDGFYRAFGVVNADGTGYHVVTSHAYTEYGEVWSPTGHRILYGRANGQGIYVIDSDSRNNHRVTRDAPPRAEWPALGWSPDGSSIVYDTGTYTNTNLYVIGIDGRNKVQLTNTPGIDIAPSWVAR